MNAPLVLHGFRGHGFSNVTFPSWLARIVFSVVLSLITSCALAGTWSDDFSANVLGAQWRGDRDHFSILDGALDGVSASPLAPVPLRAVEVGSDWDDYVVQCRMNVVTPNLL
jgi:hypothetical protein